jgi:hypothetical protein
MAVYVITDSPDVNWADGLWHSLNHFSYRHHSSDGSPTAQSEFDRRREEGQPSVLWKWENYEPREMERCHIPVPLTAVR